MFGPELYWGLITLVASHSNPGPHISQGDSALSRLTRAFFHLAHTNWSAGNRYIPGRLVKQ
jgi:hypothetical protein